MAAEYLRAPEGERAKVALGKFFGGVDWWTEVLVYYVTSTSNPAEMEDWLIKRAQAFTRRADSEYVLSGKVDERLNLLRKAIRDAFPWYRSQHPEDGIFVEKRRGKVDGEVVEEEIRRTLSGAHLDRNH